MKQVMFLSTLMLVCLFALTVLGNAMIGLGRAWIDELTDIRVLMVVVGSYCIVWIPIFVYEKIKK